MGSVSAKSQIIFDVFTDTPLNSNWTTTNGEFGSPCTFTPNSATGFLFGSCAGDSLYLKSIYALNQTPYFDGGFKFKITSSNMGGGSNKTFYLGNETVGLKVLDKTEMVTGMNYTINQTTLTNISVYENDTRLIKSLVVNDWRWTPSFYYRDEGGGDLSIDDIYSYDDDINPNLTINSPENITLSATDFMVNITASDDYALSYCFFNVTRGSSLEISNTEIPNCQNVSAVVSGDADYTIWVTANDTSNNINITSQSFKVVTTTIIGGGAVGGGGGSIVIINESGKLIMQDVCKQYKPPFEEKWDDLKQDINIDGIIGIWDYFWDYTLCKSAGSIVYLGD